MIDLALRPGHDPAVYAETFAREGFVQIPDLFPDEVADAIARVLENQVQWRLVFPEPDAAGGRVVSLTSADISALGSAALNSRLENVLRRASENYGFLYACYPMIGAYLAGEDPGHPLHTVTDFLNSREFLDFGAAVIGCPGVTKADAQATFYARGHFLTRHVDDGARKERRAAYTLGFTRVWEPDWGGLLTFLSESRDILSGWAPRFNTLTLFDGLKIHSVTQVASFAGAKRLQIVGWLRDDPPGA